MLNSCECYKELWFFILYNYFFLFNALHALLHITKNYYYWFLARLWTALIVFSGSRFVAGKQLDYREHDVMWETNVTIKHFCFQCNLLIQKAPCWIVLPISPENGTNDKTIDHPPLQKKYIVEEFHVCIHLYGLGLQINLVPLTFTSINQSNCKLIYNQTPIEPKTLKLSIAK